MHPWGSLVLLVETQFQGVIQGDWWQWAESKSNICLCLTKPSRGPGQRAVSSTNLLPPSHPLSQIAPGQTSKGSLQVGVGAAVMFWGGHDQGSHVTDCLKLLWTHGLWSWFIYVRVLVTNWPEALLNEQAWGPSNGLTESAGADRLALLLGRFCSRVLSSQPPQGHFSSFWHCSANQSFGRRLSHQHRMMRAVLTHRAGHST